MAAALTLYAVLFAATGEAPAALVLRPPAAAPTELPGDIRILRWESRYAVVTSGDPGYVRRLYAAGALLVLPFRKAGCLALRPNPAV
ncbi:hypothetical protein BC374_04695 [Ensifer sp. LC13]|nr:hypothetical protein BBX50_04630 [Ensifer sp. LC11]OCP06521.1 hypothetical protein BC374_04695 [Ensifer sp. LC13]OCP06753.1 hypothetical protein BC362_11470 [Ensifer sp. LC14]OCP31240.1 hypothetical protein BC364_05400 [Ensifer sp. LC499]